MERRLRRLVNVALECLIRLLPFLTAWVISQL